MMNNTNRPIAAGMEGLVQKEMSVLDHGFIRVVDYMGNDDAIAQAARVSYGTGTKAKSSTRGLIRYLMNHWHTTPFEMCEIKLHVKLPVFVARQWIRHRTAKVNEYSARYSILDREFYVPELEDIKPQDPNNAQGRHGSLRAEDAAVAQNLVARASDHAYDIYETLHGDPDDGLGVTRELSRMVLPPNIYTQWYWKVDLHNLLHFLRLRADPHAQWEIRQYADVMLEMVAAWVPLAHEAFMDYQHNSVSFSAPEMDVLHQYLAGIMRGELDYGNLSDRERADFERKVFPDG